MTKERVKIWVPVGIEPRAINGYSNDYRIIQYRSGYNPTLSLDYTDIDSIIKDLETIKKDYGSSYERLEFRMENEEYDDTLRPRLYGLREENDLEYEVRVETEAFFKSKKEAEERKQFELLKAKFAE